MKTQKRIGLRFFITYLCVVLPFLMMSVMIHSLSMHQMRQDARAQLSARLGRVISGMESQYARYYESGVYLASLPELSRTSMLANAVNAQKGMDRLESAYVFDRGLDDLLLYYDDSHLYGVNGMARASVYLRGDLKLNIESSQRAKEILSSDQRKAACLWRGENAGYILFHYPMPSGISVNYFIDISTFAPFLQGLAGDEEMLISLQFSEKDRLFFGYQNGNFKFLAGENAVAAQKQGKWMVFSGNSAEMDIQVELRMDEKLLHANMNRMQWSNYALLIVGMLLSSLLCVSFTNRRLTQLRNLEEAVKGVGTEHTRMGEFSNIHTLIQHTIRDNIEVMGDFKDTLRKQTARLLFHGLLREEAEYIPLLDKCDIEINEEIYFVTGIWAGTTKIPDVLADRLYCTAETAGKIVFLYLDELPNLDEGGQLRKARGEKLQEMLQSSGIENALITMSVPVDRLGAIDYAYLNALTELNRQVEDGNNNGIFVAEESLALQEYELQPEIIEELNRALTDFQAGKAQRALKKLLLQASQSELPSEIRQYLHYSILQMVVSAINKSENPADGELLLMLNQAVPEDEENFSVLLNKTVEQFCTHNAAMEDGTEILQYVQENFCREDISLEEMASHFGVSREHMSRLFRARTGMRYIDYITKLRMEKAWEMITTTDQSVSDIFRLVGYIDRSSSTKKFKKYFGITPSEARNKPGEEAF